MNRRVYLLLSLSVATLLLLSSAPTAVATDTGPEPEPVVTQEVENEMETSSEPVEVLVSLGEPGGVSTMRERKRKVGRSQRPVVRRAESMDGVRVLEEFWISNAVLLEVEPGSGYESLLNVDGVRSMRSNTEIEVSGSSVSSAPGSHAGALTAPATTARTTTMESSTPYGIDQINAPDVWSQYGTQGGGVNVAVLDTGVNVSHPDIDLRTTNSSDPTYPGGWAEFDSQGNRVEGSEPYDSEGHGTHVSGTVAGEETGVAPDANLMHGLVVNGDAGTVAQALSGMEWAVENDADVISMSLGGPTNDVWIDAVENANDAGVVVVAAVGNGGDGTSTSPGNVHDAVAVGAVDSNLDVAGFSGGEVIDTSETWGDSAPADWPDEYVVPDVVAAGVDVNSTSAGGGYRLNSGTSMSTPHVAGATALMMSASGGSGGNLGEVHRALRFTAFGSGSEEPGTRYGYGAADALAATEFVLDDAAVSGTVVNSTGSPVEEAELRVSAAPVSTSGGEYDIGLAEGSWNFEATAPGYKDKEETVTLAKDENVEKDIVLEEVQPAFFEVRSLEGPSDAVAGESMTVTATVRNTGDVSGTQDVTLRLAESGEPLDGSAVVRARSGLSIDSGSSKTVEFTVDAPGGGGEYEYGVFTDDDSATGGVTVENLEPAFFDVVSIKSPTVAETGERVTARSTVRNTGDVSGTQDVTLRLAESGEPLDGSAVVETRSELSIDSGSSKTVGFTFDAPKNDGNFDHGVFSEDDSETATLTVESPPDPPRFEVTDLRAPGNVKQGEEFDVNATVRNTGDVSGTQDVTLRLAEIGKPFDGSAVVDTLANVSLDGGEKTKVEFENLSVGEGGIFNYGVFSEDDSAEASLTAEELEPAFFEVSNLSAPAEAEAGKNISVNATVRNTGEMSGSQEVTLRLNESGKPLDEEGVVATDSVDIGSEDSVEVRFETNAPDEKGEYEYGVFSEDDNETAALTVEGDDANSGNDVTVGDNNPFGDEKNDPLDRDTVIDRVVEWNLDGTIDGVPFPRQEIIKFVVEWNTARN